MLGSSWRGKLHLPVASDEELASHDGRLGVDNEGLGVICLELRMIVQGTGSKKLRLRYKVDVQGPEELRRECGTKNTSSVWAAGHSRSPDVGPPYSQGRRTPGPPIGTSWTTHYPLRMDSIHGPIERQNGQLALFRDLS